MAKSVSSTEKRKDKRHIVRDMEVFLSDSGERLGKVINMSLSGLLITHDDAMAVDSMLQIRIPLEHSKNSLSEFEADVQVRWFRQNDMSGLFGFGLEFLGTTDEQRGAIQEMIDEFGNAGE